MFMNIYIYRKQVCIYIAMMYTGYIDGNVYFDRYLCIDIYLHRNNIYMYGYTTCK